eukprot:5291-Amorphochlora_amoeboformis.AAC.2
MAFLLPLLLLTPSLASPPCLQRTRGSPAGLRRRLGRMSHAVHAVNDPKAGAVSVDFKPSSGRFGSEDWPKSGTEYISEEAMEKAKA